MTRHHTKKDSPDVQKAPVPASHEALLNLASHRFRQCMNLLDAKRDEYTAGPNSHRGRLVQFYIGGRLTLSTPEDHCLHQFSKHLSSIMLQISKDTPPSQAFLDEKFSDAHNFLYFLELIMRERADLLNYEG